jgi:hypothetical protein
MRPNNSDFTQWHGAIIGLEPDTSYHGYDPSGIRTLESATAIVYSEAGRIVVKGCENSVVAIYDLMGRIVAHRDSRQGAEWSTAVNRGIYVVRVGNQMGQKVVVM